MSCKPLGDKTDGARKSDDAVKELCGAISSQEICARKSECIVNTKDKTCEGRISGADCDQYSTSKFQCTLLAPSAQAKLGCMARNGVCEPASNCQDLNDESQCLRAAKENCIFKNGACEEVTRTRVLPLLTHIDPAVQKWFHEAFTAFGAYLLYYQTLSKTLDKAGVAIKMSQAWAVGLPGDAANNAWLGTKRNNEGIGDIDAIDAAIVDPTLRSVWESWAQHPANLLSWIAYPVAWVKAKDFAKLKTDWLDHRVHGTMLMWTDDGLCMFSWIMALTVAGCPPALPPRPDPKKWLVEVQGNVAVTK